MINYIEDLGYISEKYDYKDELERPRIWKNELTNKTIYSKEKSLEEILNKNILKEENKIRKVDMLISLATGSINDINRIKGLKVDSLLEKVKKRIVLFDSDQTRFIYENIPEKVVRIQGLAGTGKTELLLHKLKELYLKDSNNKIVMTCFNKILQQSLEKRIPDFFNFMKVEEQIKWNERLWCISSWGSKANKNSGLYSYICNFYNIPFHSYSKYCTLTEISKLALLDLNDLNIEPCFDYILQYHLPMNRPPHYHLISNLQIFLEDFLLIHIFYLFLEFHNHKLPILSFLTNLFYSFQTIPFLIHVQT